METRRDVALVLSGGSVNGVLMELGFLQRVHESPLWERVGWVFGTSAGALAGAMAALDRLDDLESFLLALQPEDTFRAHSLWRLPLLGTHEYALPATIAERLGGIDALADALVGADRELVVCATDVSDRPHAEPHDFELVYSSRTTPPAELAQAILASAAIPMLVLPMRVGERTATDGAWTRNYPLAHAYRRAEVELIVAFRYVARYPEVDAAGLERLRRRLMRVRRVAPVRALIAELEEAQERERRGEPPHLVDVIRRLMRVAVLRNTVLEEQAADDRDQSIHELSTLRDDVVALVRERSGAGPAQAVADRFAEARFPFRHDRIVPRIVVRGSVGEVSLEPRYRDQQPWTEEAKRALIRRGWELADARLAGEAGRRL